jgi:HEAT repeat protein
MRYPVIDKEDEMMDELVNSLVKALDDPEVGVRVSAVKSLAACSAEIHEHLMKAAGDEHPFVRELAVSALGKLHRPDAMPSFLEALTDEDPRLRVAGLTAMARLVRILRVSKADPRSAESLRLLDKIAEAARSAMDDEEPYVRHVAAELIGKIVKKLDKAER